MRKLILLLSLCAVAFMVGSCVKSRQQVAEDNVKKYILENAHDPMSYEAVKFDTLKSTDEIKDITRYPFILIHKFRMKNALGAKVLTESVFMIDSSLNVAESMTFDEYVEKIKNTPPMDVIEEAEKRADSIVNAVMNKK